MSDDKGSVTIWMLGLSLLLLLFGGLALDFWRGLALQRELAAVADSAAVAGASGIDVEVYRSTGQVVLDPARAAELASGSISFQDVDLVSTDISVASDGLLLTVSVRAEVEPLMMGAFIEDDSPLLVGATASAEPRLTP